MTDAGSATAAITPAGIQQVPSRYGGGSTPWVRGGGAGIQTGSYYRCLLERVAGITGAVGCGGVGP